MNISKRLNRLADMVTEGSRLADVGTDHGYVPLCLCRQKKIPSAIAMDVNKGPLDRAKSHIREDGLEEKIDTRLSDGLEALREGEADTVLIAGMGGALTERILREGGEALSSVSELVLQPQSEIWKVREWLWKNDWKIVCEDMVLDEGKYYPMFRAVRGREETPYSEGELRFGRAKLQKSPKLLEAFLEKRLLTIGQIEAGLPEEKEERLLERRGELAKEKELLTEYLEILS